MKSKIDLFIDRQLLEDLDTTVISTKVHGEERVHVRSEVISGAIEGLLQRMKNTNYCWICETAYDPALAPQCPTCHTRVCPNGHCFCVLSPEAQRAVEMAMKTYGLWTGNPRKRASGLAEDLYYAYLEKGLVRDKADFDRRHQELYKSHPEVVEEIRRSRGSKS